MKPRAFTLNGVKFYEYHAKDSHGSECHTFIVDGKSTTYRGFHTALAKVLKDSGGFESIYQGMVNEYFKRH